EAGGRDARRARGALVQEPRVQRHAAGVPAFADAILRHARMLRVRRGRSAGSAGARNSRARSRKRCRQWPRRFVMTVRSSDPDPLSDPSSGPFRVRAYAPSETARRSIAGSPANWSKLHATIRVDVTTT